MDIQKVISEYDSMFGSKTPEEIGAFLASMIDEATRENDDSALFTLLNEQIGFARDTGDEETSIGGCSRLMDLSEKMGIAGTLPYATSLMNIANAYRAFRRFEEAGPLYDEIEKIFTSFLPAGAQEYAALYNNKSVYYMDIHETENAVSMLRKALEIVDRSEEAIINQATSRVNLALALMQTESGKEEASGLLLEAFERFEAAGGNDYHYSAALSAYGDLMAGERNNIAAAACYDRAMQIMKSFMGENPKYNSIKKKRDKALADMSASESSLMLYESKGADMIRRFFPGYENRIAVGVAGEGSDCFGFDDDISRDHDYGAGFCMWLTDEDFDAIGEELQKRYDEISEWSSPRRGVMRISDFFKRILGEEIDTKTPSLTDAQWLRIPASSFAAAVNGTVYRDDLGAFTKVREMISAHCPEHVFYMRLANALHDFSAYAQANYPRAMARRDAVSAELCRAKGIEAAIDLAFLTEKKFAPYYKWKQRALKELEGYEELASILEQIASMPLDGAAWDGYAFDPTRVNGADQIASSFEKAAGILAGKLFDKGYISSKESFLEYHTGEAADKVAKAGRTAGQSEKDKLIQRLINTEWEQFTSVNSISGRASCQDNRKTFELIRRAQFMNWPRMLLESYLSDLEEAAKEGRNLPSEKYARMMESTSPEEYAMIRDFLPPLSDSRRRLLEEVAAAEVAWSDDMALRFPKYMKRGRPVHSSEDTRFVTSIETYLKGELSSYSDRTFSLYAEWISELSKNGKNLAEMTARNIVSLNGYESLEAVEASLL